VIQEKQLFLRLEIILHGAVVVQVLSAEVGENNHVEADTPDPFLLQGMGRDLEQAVGISWSIFWSSGASGVVRPAWTLNPGPL